MSDEVRWAFVYGTLLRSERNHARFCGDALTIEPASTTGRLYDLHAGFPAMVQAADGTVHGEGKTLKAIRPADVGRFLKSDALLRKPNGADRAKPTVDQIARVLLEWAQAQGTVETVAFPKSALPKRRRKATSPAPTAAD